MRLNLHVSQIERLLEIGLLDPDVLPDVWEHTPASASVDRQRVLHRRGCTDATWRPDPPRPAGLTAAELSELLGTGHATCCGCLDQAEVATVTLPFSTFLAWEWLVEADSALGPADTEAHAEGDNRAVAEHVGTLRHLVWTHLPHLDTPVAAHVSDRVSRLLKLEQAWLGDDDYRLMLAQVAAFGLDIWREETRFPGAPRSSHVGDVLAVLADRPVPDTVEEARQVHVWCTAGVLAGRPANRYALGIAVDWAPPQQHDDPLLYAVTAPHAFGLTLYECAPVAVADGHTRDAVTAALRLAGATGDRPTPATVRDQQAHPQVPALLAALEATTA